MTGFLIACVIALGLLGIVQDWRLRMVEKHIDDIKSVLR